MLIIVMYVIQVIWKHLYQQSSKGHGTLGFFQSLLNRRTVKKDPKAAVDASLEFITTVVTGHVIGSACEVLDIATPDARVELPLTVVRAIQNSSLHISKK